VEGRGRGPPFMDPSPRYAPVYYHVPTKAMLKLDRITLM